MISQPTQILSAVAAVQTGISVTGSDGRSQAVTAAYPFLQWNVAGLNCPFFANKIGGGPARFTAQGRRQRESTVAMYLCLQPVNQNASLAVSLEYALDWADAVFTAFDAHLRLGGALGFLELAQISHWDLVTAALGTTEYHALKFDLSVTETYTAAIGL